MANEEQLRDYLRRVTIELADERGRLHAFQHEPIAIVGMACRYPAGIGSPAELWRLLAEGGDGIGGFPTDRGWDLERLYDPDPDAPATSYAREGGFLADPGSFDADFFGIAPREAIATDPQQRLLLETCWEALEDAGIDPALLREGQTGVFAGIMHHDYGPATPGDAGDLEGYLGTGLAGAIASGRIAYQLGLEGPAITLDTACSSSLVAMHLAAQALRGGECGLVLAGGATVLATPTVFTEFARQRGLAPDGRCKSFADSADGVGWSEGVGMLVLERLSDAQANGHPIHAVIRGSAVNQDGASNGLTAPNGPSQERVIRQALANARLEPKDIDAVEAHGTGTTLGDPIEAGALLATYGQDRETPLKLGSIKSNIGHTQAAAGVAGVIKMALAMREGVLPKTLHVDAPSSKVDWEAGEIELLTEAEEWKANGGPRRAAVSSFGISGTNAHVILEEAPETSAPEAGEDEDGGAPASNRLTGQSETPTQPLPGPTPLALSAKTPEALHEAAGRLATHLGDNPQLDPTDVAYSLVSTRAALEQRAVVLGTDRKELGDALEALGRGEQSPATVAARATQARLAYLYSGQGSQRLAMGKQLYETHPTYRDAFDQACAELDPQLGASLKEIVFAEGEQAKAALDHTANAQPALFATQVALHRLLESKGMAPELLAGHSIGELSALHLAGVLSLPDAAKLIGARAKLMGALPEGGAMIAIEASEAEVSEAIAGKEAELSIAAINGPSSVVISGAEQAAEQVQSLFSEQGRKTKRLSVSHAFHSPLIEPMLEDFAEVASTLDYQEPKIPILSALSGELLDPAQATDPAYWVSHAREPVRFADAIEGLARQGASTFIELGPDPVLSAMAQQCLEGQDRPFSFAPTLRGGREEAETLTQAIATAHAAGAKLDWGAFFAGANPKAVSLPTYPFQRKRYWIDSTASSSDPTSIGQASAEHPLLSTVIEHPQNGAVTLTGRLSIQSHPWLADHAVLGSIFFPGTAFLELALRAGRQVGAETVEELTLQAPLVLPEQGAIALQVTVNGPGEQGTREISIHSRSQAEEGAGEWSLHAQGILSPEAPVAPEPLGEWPPPGAERLETEDLYERLAELGFEYGPAFQGLEGAWKDGETIYAEVSLGEAQASEAGSYGIHPALLDSAFHASLDVGLAGSSAGGEGPRTVTLPFSWSGVRLYSSAATSLRMRMDMDGQGGSFSAVDQDGALVVSTAAALVRPIEIDRLRESASADWLFGVDWVEPDVEAPGAASIAVLGDRAIDGVDAELYADIAALAEALAAGDEVSEMVLLDLGAALAERALPEAAHTATRTALSLLQAWLAEDALASTRLTLLTRGAVAVAEGESPDLRSAPIWGLVRSAQSEHPDRFSLLDLDDLEASQQALASALTAAAENPQLAIRDGQVLAPRLARVRSDEGAEHAPREIDPNSTVLITGGTGGIGARVARHLAERHGARHLLLASRSGEGARGGTALREELEALGAEVTIAACDVSERGQLEALIEAIPSEHPLGAVIHSSAVLDDGTLGSLDGEHLERVLRPKADAAWHLHELTADMPLDQFLMFSSATGVVGGAGQASYAAANTFLDALAAKRRAEGLVGTSLAWGLWTGESNLASDADSAELSRRVEQVRARLGFAPMPPERGLGLFDAARSRRDPLLVPAELDIASLRAQAKAGALPAILRGLVRVPARRPQRTDSLARQLAGLGDRERESFVRDLVRAHSAAVLGHDSPADVDPERAFQELGFDSLAAVELRNRLGAATGLRLAPTLVFDYPTVAALAEFLGAEVAGDSAAAAAPRASVSSEEPIAVVGISCRYPGGVASPEGLWKLLRAGADAISPFPADRGWDLERLYDPDPDNIASCYAREGGFMADAGEFDAGFFGIAPREALAVDPQQRLLLEATWEALEDAGIDPTTLRGSEAGVFAGVMYQDYGAVEAGIAPGMTTGAVSGRISYTLGLEGPAMTVDTACSSSLVATHLASQALRSGECGLALAGGVTVLSTPGMLTFFSNQRGLSPDGRCKSFSEAADGVGFAEGVGMLVLERLSDAQANGHHIHAVIRGSAVNQDGASNGLTAPNGPSQERVIRQALANARLEPRDIDAVEAHGTGTTLGDPIEAGALLATYGQDRETPLKLGSIKSNIGHTQAAAGVAGVIKMALAMREGVLPKTLHVDQPSSKVDWEAGEIELLTEATPWQANGEPRRAAVSSFGASGTNAHLILEEAPARVGDEDGGAPASNRLTGQSETPTQPLPGPTPLALSAKTPEALHEAAGRLATHLGDNPQLDPTDVAYSLVSTRAALEQRAVVLGTDRKELGDALEALGRGEPTPTTAQARATQARLAYLYSGQGSQRLAMGKQLYETYPTYRDAFDQACAELDPQLGASLKEIVFAEGEQAKAALDHTANAQPALFATQVALHRLLESKGMAPELLAGHSIGELSALHLAGVLSLSDAAKLIGARAKLMGALSEGGAMIAIEANEAEVSEAIAGKEAELSIAAINGPSSVVISGVEQAAEQVQSLFSEQGRKTKRLSVSHAFHSPLIEPMLEDFAEVASTLDYQEPKIPILSALSGELLDPAQATDPAYWVSHAREPVRFADAIEGLAKQGACTFIELGPDPVLSAMAQQCLEGRDRPFSFAPTLRGGREEAETLTQAIATAHAAGAKLDWGAFFAGANAKRVSLPTYPFQRKRYWIDSTGSASDPTSIGQASAEHPLLSTVIEHPQNGAVTLTGRLSIQSHPWLADHAVLGSIFFPGTAFLELALRAGRQVGAETVEELTLQAPLILPESGAVALQVSIAPPDERGSRELSIHSRPQGQEGAEWIWHAQGVLTPQSSGRPELTGQWPPSSAQRLEIADLYGHLADLGLEYGPAFQGLEAAWKDGEKIYAEVSLGEEQAREAGRYGVHPALLDSAFHAGIFAFAGLDALQLPFAWQGISLHAGGAPSLRVCIDASSERLEVLFFDPSGAPVMAIDSSSVREVDSAKLEAVRPRPLYRLDWATQSAEGQAQVRLAILGQAEIEGAEAERYPDLAALEEAIAAGAEPPKLVLAELCPAGAEMPAAAHEATADALELAQAWLASEPLGGSRLALLAKGAVAAGEAAQPDLRTAAAWGLLRSAQSEHPGRFALIDSDYSEASNRALPIALGSEEPQLALREGELLAPRLERAEIEATERPLDPEATVLITGATGGLGAALATHLAKARGVRHLLLVSRSGAEAEGATDLAQGLKDLGAEVRIEACDVAEREQVAALLDSIPPEHPLGAVIHSAAVVDDGVIDSLDRERLAAVMRPKADGAWHLHELTKGLELSHFVLFSSLMGLLGGAAQANYAAANAFLDALAAHRQAEGLPATSLAWGALRIESSKLTAELDRVAQMRMGRLGFSPISPEQALELFDLATALDTPLLAPVAFDAAALRAQAKVGTLPAILRALVHVPARREAQAGSLAQLLASVPEAERQAAVTELVRSHTAAVLGHSSPLEVDPERAFQELGFDSLAAVELRNRLGAATGVRLAPTLVFDYPSAAAVAGYLLAEVGGDVGSAADLGEAEFKQALERLEATLAVVGESPEARRRAEARLRAALVALSAPSEPGADGDNGDLKSMSEDEMFELIDQEFGSS